MTLSPRVLAAQEDSMPKRSNRFDDENSFCVLGIKRRPGVYQAKEEGAI